MNRVNPIPEDLIRSLHYEGGELFWSADVAYNVKRGDMAGHVHSNGYRRVAFKGRLYQASRIIYVMFHGETELYIDHIDKNPLNNRLDNLRAVDCSKNGLNRVVGVNNSSGVVGVHFRNQYQKWSARICINGRRKDLGLHRTLFDAAAARLSYENKMIKDWSAA